MPSPFYEGFREGTDIYNTVARAGNPLHGETLLRQFLEAEQIARIKRGRETPFRTAPPQQSLAPPGAPPPPVLAPLQSLAAPTPRAPPPPPPQAPADPLSQRYFPGRTGIDMGVLRSVVAAPRLGRGAPPTPDFLIRRQYKNRMEGQPVAVPGPPMPSQMDQPVAVPVPPLSPAQAFAQPAQPVVEQQQGLEQPQPLPPGVPGGFPQQGLEQPETGVSGGSAVPNPYNRRLFPYMHDLYESLTGQQRADWLDSIEPPRQEGSRSGIRVITATGPDGEPVYMSFDPNTGETAVLQGPDGGALRDPSLQVRQQNAATRASVQDPNDRATRDRVGAWADSAEEVAGIGVRRTFSQLAQKAGDSVQRMNALSDTQLGSVSGMGGFLPDLIHTVFGNGDLAAVKRELEASYFGLSLDHIKGLTPVSDTDIQNLMRAVGNDTVRGGSPREVKRSINNFWERFLKGRLGTLNDHIDRARQLGLSEDLYRDAEAFRDEVAQYARSYQSELGRADGGGNVLAVSDVWRPELESIFEGEGSRVLDDRQAELLRRLRDSSRPEDAAFLRRMAEGR